MTTSNVMPLVILFMVMHFSLIAVPASSAKARGGAPPVAGSNAYMAARRAVDRSLALAKETAGLLTRTRADLNNDGKGVRFLDYCIQFSQHDVGDMTTVRAVMAKGKRQIDVNAANDIVFSLETAVEYTYNCADGLMDTNVSDPRLGAVMDHLSSNAGIYEATVHIVARALNRTTYP